MSIPKSWKNIKPLTLFLGCFVGLGCLAALGGGLVALRAIQEGERARKGVIVAHSRLYPVLSEADMALIETRQRAAQVASLVLVGSARGKVFYASQCGGVRRIKPENLITFKDVADAVAKGYRPASNCPALDVLDQHEVQ